MNYSGLKTAIADWLHRDGISQIPTFIELATARLTTDLRVAQMEARTTVTATSEYVNLPTDYSSMRYVTFNGKRGDYKRPELIVDMVYQNWLSDPPVYTIVAGQLRICPAPTTASPTTVEMVYFAQLPALSDTVTNWALTDHPHLYLAACMVEARNFVKAGTWQEWEQRYQQHVEQLEQQSEYLNFGGPLNVSVN